MRVWASVACIAVAGLTLFGHTDPWAVHRPIPPQHQACSEDFALGPDNVEGGPAAACHVQNHIIPGDQGQAWQALATEANRVLAQPDRYTLHYVELSEVSGGLHQPGQLHALVQDIQQQRQAGRQNYVVVYVHGWRHDASIGDPDAQKFRTLLALSRAALNTRCVAQGDYCDTSVTGVFISWRGRMLREPIGAADGDFSPWLLPTIPSFPWRKALSERLSVGPHAALPSVLGAIQDQLALAQGDASADKLLITGHSLGANMLAKVMLDRVGQGLAQHRSGATFAPPLGDLVVLLNPASEARNWTDLQRQERALAGLGPQDRSLSAPLDTALGQKLLAWRNLYPLNQRPVYVSLTNADHWGASARVGRAPGALVKSDQTSGFSFNAGRGIWRAREDRVAIGHLLPAYAARLDADGRDQRKFRREPLGTSHEMTVLRGQGQTTGYDAAMVPQRSWCAPAQGWLLQARQQGGWTNGAHWDWGLDPASGAPIPNVGRGPRGAAIQWRNRIYSDEVTGGWSVAPGTSPFWNVRATDTVFAGHAHFVNYPMWCGVQQLVLDDVAAPPPPAPATRPAPFKDVPMASLLSRALSGILFASLDDE